MPVQTGPVQSLEVTSFSPSGKWLAVGSMNNSLPRLAFVCTSTGAVLRTWSPAAQPLTSASEPYWMLAHVSWQSLRRIVVKVCSMVESKAMVYVVALD